MMLCISLCLGAIPTHWSFLQPYADDTTLMAESEEELKSMGSSVLSLHYGSTLTSLHDYWIPRSKRLLIS